MADYKTTYYNKMQSGGFLPEGMSADSFHEMAATQEGRKSFYNHLAAEGYADPNGFDDFDKEVGSYYTDYKPKKKTYSKERLDTYISDLSKGRDYLLKEQDNTDGIGREWQMLGIAANGYDRAIKRTKASMNDDNFFVDVYEGFTDRAGDRDMKTVGVSDLQEMYYLFDISKKYDEETGELKKGEKLTKGEQAMMQSFIQQQWANENLETDLGYDVGQGAAASVPFMVQMAITGGVSGAVAKGAGKVLQAVVKRSLGKLVKTKIKSKALKAVGKWAGRSAIQAGMNTNTYKNIYENYAGNVEKKDDGSLGFDPDSQMDGFEGAYRGAVSGFAEIGSERLGLELLPKATKSFFRGVLGETTFKKWGKIGVFQVAKRINNTAFNNKVMIAAGVQNGFFEGLEEYSSAIISDIANLEYNETKKYIEDEGGRNNLTMWLTVQMTSGAMGGGSLVVNGTQKINYSRKLNKELKKKRKELVQFLGENDVATLDKGLKERSQEEIAKGMLHLFSIQKDGYMQGDLYSPKQKEAIMNYVGLSMRKTGVEGGVFSVADEYTKQAHKEIDGVAHDDGMLIKIEDREGNGHYVASGNVLVNEDGTVDVENSDEMIALYDADTQERKSVSIKDIASVLMYEDVATVKDQVHNQITTREVEKHEQETAEPSLTSEDKVRVKMEDGTEQVGEIIEVGADNEGNPVYDVRIGDKTTGKTQRYPADRVERFDEEEIEEDFSDIKPVGVGVFGNIYDQFKGKAKQAVQFLMGRKEGEVVGALSHKDIGAIDLVWGKEGTGKSDGYGLAKLVKYHPEVLDNIQEILSDTKIVKRTENRIQLESDTHQASVRLDWDNNRKTWLLTMFEKENSVPNNTTDTDKTSKGNENDTATPENTVSTDKDSENVLPLQLKVGKGEVILEPLGNGVSVVREEYESEKSAQTMLKRLQGLYPKLNWRVEVKEGKDAYTPSSFRILAQEKGTEQQEVEQEPIALYEQLAQQDKELAKETMQEEATRLRQKASALQKQAAGLPVVERFAVKKTAKELERRADEFERLAKNGSREVQSYKEKRATALETDNATLPLRGLIAKYFLSGGKINVNVLEELGIKQRTSEFGGLFRFVSKDAPTIDGLEEVLLQDYNESLADAIRTDTNRFRNELLDVLSGDTSAESLADVVLESANEGVSNAEQQYVEQKEQEYNTALTALMERGYTEEEAKAMLEGKPSEEKQEEFPDEFAPDDDVPFSKEGVDRLSDNEADVLLDEMRKNATSIPQIEMNEENWVAEFGEDGVVETPVGNVMMGDNQYMKMRKNGRSSQFGMLKPTLTNPDAIIEDLVNITEGAERETSYLFVKSFKNTDGTKDYFFTSVSVKKGSNEVVVSNHIKRASKIKDFLKNGKLLYRFDTVASGSSIPANTTRTTSQETDNAGVSVNKGSKKSLTKQETVAEKAINEIQAQSKNPVRIKFVTSEELPVWVRNSKDYSDTWNALNDGRGTVYMRKGAIDTADKAVAKWIHEVGLHGGIRQLIPDEAKRNDLMLKVYESAKELAKTNGYFSALVRFVEDNYTDDAVRGEEVLAYLSEKVVKKEQLTEQEQGFWNKIVSLFRGLLFRTYGKGARLLSFRDMELIIQASVHTNFRENEHTHSKQGAGGGVRQSKQGYDSRSESLSERERNANKRSREEADTGRGRILSEVGENGYSATEIVPPQAKDYESALDFANAQLEYKKAQDERDTIHKRSTPQESRGVDEVFRGTEKTTSELRGRIAENQRNARKDSQTISERQIVSETILSAFKDAVSGKLKGKPIEVGRLTEQGREYLQELSGLTFKENISFVLNPSDLAHIYNDHYGNNEKDKGNNIPLTDADIENMADVISNPDAVVFLGYDKKTQSNKFSFLKENNNGAYNLLEVYSGRRGNLTAKTFFNTKKGVAQRVMDLQKPLLSTSETYFGTNPLSTKVPVLFENSKSQSNEVRFSLQPVEYDLSAEKERYNGNDYEVKGDDVYTTVYNVNENTPSYTEHIESTTGIDEAEQEALSSSVVADDNYTTIDIDARHLKIPIDAIVEEYGLDIEDYETKNDIAEEYIEEFVRDVDVEDYIEDDDSYNILQSQEDNTDTDQIIYDVKEKLSNEFGVRVGKYTNFYVDRDGNMTDEMYDTENEDLENLEVSMRIADHTHNPRNGHNDLNVLIAENDHTDDREFARIARTDLEYDSDATVDEIVEDIKEYWKDYARDNYDSGLRFSKQDPTLSNSDFDENGEVKPEVLEEIKNEKLRIKNEAKANGTYLKAPNGKATNLSEDNWLNVRTRRFKRWFGDWEKSARIEKLRNAKSIEISGKEITPSEDLKQYKRNALEYGLGLRTSYTNKDTGRKIELGRKGVKEVLNHDYKDVEHLQSISAIPQIIEDAVYITTMPNEDVQKRPDIKEYEYYVTGLKIGGVDYTVRAVVAVSNTGDKYYDHKLSQIEKGDLLSITSRTTPQIENNPLSENKDTKLISILQNDASKVVYENGEPLVVYHGTEKGGFTTFNQNKGEKRDTGYFGDKGFYFTSFKEKAEGYADAFYSHENKRVELPKEAEVFEAFLNIKTPLNIRENVKYYASEYIPPYLKSDDVISQGKDGVVVKIYPNKQNEIEELGYDNEKELSGSDRLVLDKILNNSINDEYVVFNPNQIKSATSNVGTYSESGDIRFSLTAYNGSPNKFSEFDMSWLYSGEGASGFGEGLHFTESVDDAVGYAQKLGEDGKGYVYKVELDTEIDELFDISRDMYNSDQSGYVLELLKSLPFDVKAKLYLDEVAEGYRNENPNDYEEDFAPVIESIQEYLQTEETPKEQDTPKEIIEELDNQIEREHSRSFFDAIQEKVFNNYEDAESKTSELLKDVGIKGNTHTEFGDRHYIMFGDEGISVTARKVGSDDIRFSKNFSSREELENSKEFQKFNNRSTIVEMDEANDYDFQKGKRVTVVGLHGTKSMFNVFDISRLGENGRAEGSGFYFSNSTEIGDRYSNNEGRVIKAYIHFDKPLMYDTEFTDGELRTYLEKVDELHREALLKDPNEDPDYTVISDFGDIEDAIEAMDGETVADVMGGLINTGLDAEIANEALTQSLGYDGFISNGFGNDGGDLMIYVPLHSNQIKDYSLETKDDEGNIIPPSKRFNSRNYDIRFSLIGKQGASNLDQAEERTTRLDNLNVAREMESSKKDAKAIRLATGWERGADGKWRYEIPDLEVTDKFIDLDETDVRMPLGEVIKDKGGLFEAYPTLKDINVIIRDTKEYGGSYDKENKLIEISDYLGEFDPIKNKDKNTSVLLHEIQHAIQDIEGFERGGGVNMFKESRGLTKKMFKDLGASFDEMGYSDWLKKADAETHKRIKERGGNFAGLYEFAESRNANLRDKMITKLDVANNIIKGNDAIFGKYGRYTDLNDAQLYERLSGETEARNVQRRLGLTEEQRRNTLLSETEDVAREDQIFLRGRNERSEMRFSKADLNKTNNTFNQELEQLKSGTLPKGHIFQMGRPMEILQSTGMPDLPIELTAKKLKEKSVQKEHIFELSEVKDLPKAVQEPMAVFNSSTMKGRKVIFTELTHKDKNFVVALELNYNKGKISVNDVRSIYPRNNTQIVRSISNNEAVYLDKEKMLEWIGRQRFNSAEATKNSNTATKVINSFENPRVEGEMSESDLRFSKEMEMPIFPQAKDYDDAFEYGKDLGVWNKQVAMWSEDMVRLSKGMDKPNRDDFDNDREWAKANERFVAEKRTFTNKAKEKVLDHLASVADLQEEVEKENGVKLTLENGDNVYKAEIARTSIGKYALDDFNDRFLVPLNKAIASLKKSGATYDEVKEYMIAKHAIERNAYMAKQYANDKSKQLPDGNYSGMTTAAAEKIVVNFESLHSSDLVKELWKRVNLSTQWSLDYQKKMGLISRSQRSFVTQMYKNYVPLRGWEEDTSADIFDYIHKPIAPSSLQKNKKAEGRTSMADDPVVFIASMAESAVLLGGKNKVRQAFLRMVRNNPDVSKYRVVDVWQLNTGTTDNPNWVEVDYKPDDSVIKAGKAYNTRKHLEGHRVTPLQTQARQIAVYENGEKVVVEVVDPLIASAIKGDNVYRLKGFNWIGNTTRMMSRNFTSRNPAFTLVNLTRDMGYATLMNSIKYGNGSTFVANTGKTSSALYKYIVRGKDLKSMGQMGKHIENFLKYGGETGFLNIRDIETIRKEIQRKQKELADPNLFRNLNKGLHTVLDWVEKGNRIAEDLSRFTTYYTLVQQGMHPKEAAFEAKEITVNFNRHGAVGGAIGTFYAFFNAAMQGVNNFASVAKKHPKSVAGAMMGFAMTGFLLPMLNRFLGGYDDEEEKYYYDMLPDYVRSNHLVICYGNGDFLKIPLPHILRAFYGWGEAIDGYVSGNNDLRTTVSNMVGNFADDLSPVSVSGGDFRSLLPTFAIPFYDVSVNENFAKYQIHKEAFIKSQEGIKPAWQMASTRTAPVFTWLSKTMNALGGGNDATPAGISFKNGKVVENKFVNAAFDWNPSNLEHIVEGFGGGMMTFMINTYKLGEHGVKKLAGGESEMEISRVPIARRFMAKSKPQSVASKYYTISNEVTEYNNRVRELEKAGMTNVWKELKYNPVAMERSNWFKMYDKQIRKLKKHEKQATGVYLERIEEQKEQLMREMVKKIKEIDTKAK